jgi:hypothetical protein
VTWHLHKKSNGGIKNYYFAAYWSALFSLEYFGDWQNEPSPLRAMFLSVFRLSVEPIVVATQVEDTVKAGLEMKV